MTTVSTLITEARRRFNQTSATFHTDADLLAYTDEAQMYVVTETNCLEEISTSSVVGSQQAYALPSDYQDLDRLLYEGERILRVDKTQIDELDIIESEHSGVPECYYIYNSQFYLFPIPSTSTTGDELKLFYYKKPATLSSTSSVLETDTRFDSAIVAYMTYLAFLKEKEFDMADYHLAECNAKIKSVMIKLNEKTDGHYRMKLGRSNKFRMPLRNWE